MAGPATFRLWIAFGVQPFDSAALALDANWVDVTDDLRRSGSFSTSQRRSQFDTFVAGQGLFALNNRARRFDSNNAAGSYFGDFERNTPIRVTAEHSSTRYTVWSGYTRTWKSSYVNAVDSVTTVQAVDGLGLLARYDLPKIAAAYGGDTAAVRCGRVFDNIGVPAGLRSLNNGGATSTLAATTWGVNALRHIIEVVIADAGMFYCQPDGTFTHDSRNSIATESRQLTSQVSFDDVTEPVFQNIEFAAVGDNYRDLVRVSGSSGVVQEVDNTVANAAPVTLQKLGTPLESDAAAATTAKFYADLYSTETSFPTSISTRIATGDTDLRTVLLPRQLRDRISVTYGPPGGGADITADCFIDGITHVVSLADWKVSYRLSSADAYDDNLSAAPSTWLIIGDATRGKIGLRKIGY